MIDAKKISATEQLIAPEGYSLEKYLSDIETNRHAPIPGLDGEEIPIHCALTQVIQSLLGIVECLRRAKKTHLDIKEGNIIVRGGHSHGCVYMNAILIDFDTVMDTDKDGYVHKIGLIHHEPKQAGRPFFGRDEEGKLTEWTLSERKIPFNGWNEDAFATAYLIMLISERMYKTQAAGVVDAKLKDLIYHMYAESKMILEHMRTLEHHKKLTETWVDEAFQNIRRTCADILKIKNCNQTNTKCLAFMRKNRLQLHSPVPDALIHELGLTSSRELQSVHDPGKENAYSVSQVCHAADIEKPAVFRCLPSYSEQKIAKYMNFL